MSTSDFVVHEVCVCYIQEKRNTSDVLESPPKLFLPFAPSPVSEQSTIGSYNTHFLLAQTFLLIYVLCLDWGIRERAGAHSTAALV